MKQRLLAGLLSTTMLLSMASPAVACLYHSNDVDCINTEAIAVAGGSISVNVIFENNETITQAHERDVKLTLHSGRFSSETISLANPPDNISGYPLSVAVRDSLGVVDGDSEYMGWYAVTIGGLDTADYYITLEGNNHVKYTSSTLVIDTYSKVLSVSTAGVDFTFGDVNKDGVVDQLDLDDMAQGIEIDNKEFDLSGDGKVDITDLAIIKSNIANQSAESILDGAIINIVEKINTAEILDTLNENVEVTGDIASIFDPTVSEAITFTNTDAEEISVDTPLIIPIVFDEPVEMSQIEIVSPVTAGGIEGGTATVIYIDEDGQEQEAVFSFGSVADIYYLTNDGTNTVVINLGERIVVKTITVSVEKVAGEENTFAVIEEVTFLVDVVPEDPQASNGIIENLKATSGNESVSLTWDKVPNMAGYIVSYGKSSGNYTNTVKVDTNSFSVGDLDNFATYYFTVQSYYDDWSGSRSSEVVGKPLPTSVPGNVSLTGLNAKDMGAQVIWTSDKNAVGYNVYVKETDSTDDFALWGTSGGTSMNIGSLDNDTEYSVKVAAYNAIGQGNYSNTMTVIPEHEDILGPAVPTYNRIDNSHITNVWLTDTRNIDTSSQPNGFDISFVYDNDYSTYWCAAVWYYDSCMYFEFDEAFDMDHMVWVGRIDGSWRNSLGYARMWIWTDEDDLNGSSSYYYQDGSIRTTDVDGEMYSLVEFGERMMVRKIAIQVCQWNGSPTNVSLSEAIFYEYHGIDDMVANWFADDAFTTLRDDVTIEEILETEELLATADGYIANHLIVQEEIEMAKELYYGNELTSFVKTDFVEIDSTGDDAALSNISPLGVLAFTGTQVAIYADIPDGSSIEIICSQFYADPFEHIGSAIQLVPGRNVIDVEVLSNLSVTKGGPLYYRSSGDGIKLHITNVYNSTQHVPVVQMPTLELYDFYEITEDEARDRIRDYIEFLSVYATQSISSAELNPTNSTEISLRNVLLSLPAVTTYAGITSAGSTIEAQVDGLYNNILAWEELLMVCNVAYGLDDYENPRSGRQNIRYMRMSSSAYMYAAGNHIGVQYGSCASLLKGTPTSVTGEGNSNNLFGWGIAHEIGHNLDRLGYAEITNNIYSLLAQTWDGGDSAGSSRVQAQSSSVYSKVTSGSTGQASNVFTQLTLYWQLQAAYCDNDPLAFYNAVNKQYKYGGSSEFSGDNRFAVIVSRLVERDLTDFFTAWGYTLSDSAKAAMSVYPAEERFVQYMNDYVRALRLEGYTSNANADYSVSVALSGTKSLVLTIENADATDILGYEVYRNGSLIGFTTSLSYTDTINSMNNIALEYSVRAVDVLGYPMSNTATSNQIRLEWDDVIASSAYVLSETETGVMYEFKNSTSISGLLWTNAPESGEFVASIAVEYTMDDDTVVLADPTVAKYGDFTINASTTDGKFINYFNKVGVDTTDTRIGVYDAKVLYVDGVTLATAPSVLGYIGDNVSLTSYVMGTLAHDFDTGAEVLEAGDVIVVGEYLGDVYFNNITLQGRFAENSGVDGSEITYIERAIAGKTYMFAYATETVTTISDGLFIFKLDVENEAELQTDGSDCGALSLYPEQIKAVMTRVSDTGSYQTSDTVWTDTPSEYSMPEIVLN